MESRGHINTLCACGCNEPVRSGKKYILGHNRRKPTNIDKICYLYVERKFSPYEISEKLGYSVNRVKRCLRQRNVELKNLSQAAILVAQKGKNYMQTEEGRREHSKMMKGHSHNRIYDYNQRR